MPLNILLNHLLKTDENNYIPALKAFARELAKELQATDNFSDNFTALIADELDKVKLTSFDRATLINHLAILHRPLTEQLNHYMAIEDEEAAAEISFIFKIYQVLIGELIRVQVLQQMGKTEEEIRKARQQSERSSNYQSADETLVRLYEDFQRQINEFHNAVLNKADTLKQIDELHQQQNIKLLQKLNAGLAEGIALLDIKGLQLNTRASKINVFKDKNLPAYRLLNNKISILASATEEAKELHTRIASDIKLAEKGEKKLQDKDIDRHAANIKKMVDEKIIQPLTDYREEQGWLAKIKEWASDLLNKASNRQLSSTGTGKLVAKRFNTLFKEVKIQTKKRHEYVKNLLHKKK